MPFGYSKEIFKYPPVQYIPLDRYNETFGKYPSSLNSTRLYLYTPDEENLLNKKLKSLGKGGDYQINKDQLAILIINGKVNLLQYRGYEVILVGRPDQGHFQAFTISSNYFYKDRLIFTLYNGTTNEKIDWVRLDPVPKYR